MPPKLNDDDRTAAVDDLYIPPECGELSAIADLFAKGRLSGGADVVAEYECALATWFGVERAIAVSSGTAAIRAALVAVGVGSDSEVIVPATAPLPTVLPVLTCNARPVFVDVRPWSLTLDPEDVERKISRRTRAAILLPMWGYPNSDGEGIAVLRQAAVPIVEDACQAHGTIIGGRHAGTIGDIGCFSTHDRKMLATGEGGFVLSNDAELAERVDFYTRLGHLRGETHGENFKLAAPLAAIGLRRLATLRTQVEGRRRNARIVLDILSSNSLLRELTYEPHSRPNYYSLVLVADNHQSDIAAVLSNIGLPPDSVRYGYRPAYHRSIFAAYVADCRNAEMLAKSSFQLPVHPGVSDTNLRWLADHIDRIVDE